MNQPDAPVEALSHADAKTLVLELEDRYSLGPADGRRFGQWVLETYFSEQLSTYPRDTNIENLFHVQRTVDAGYYLMAMFKRGTLPHRKVIDALTSA